MWSCPNCGINAYGAMCWKCRNGPDGKPVTAESLAAAQAVAEQELAAPPPVSGTEGQGFPLFVLGVCQFFAVLGCIGAVGGAIGGCWLAMQNNAPITACANLASGLLGFVSSLGMVFVFSGEKTTRIERALRAALAAAEAAEEEEEDA